VVGDGGGGDGGGGGGGGGLGVMQHALLKYCERLIIKSEGNLI
jgi:hypothetical protein